MLKFIYWRCAVESEPAGVGLIQNNAASPEFTFKSFVWRHIDLYSDDQKIYVHCEVSACIQPNDGSYTCPSFNSVSWSLEYFMFKIRSFLKKMFDKHNNFINYFTWKKIYLLLD